MIWFYYMLADYLIFALSPEVVAVAEQPVKVSINSFCDAITLLSQTSAKAENVE